MQRLNYSMQRLIDKMFIDIAIGDSTDAEENVPQQSASRAAYALSSAGSGAQRQRQ
jgi:hypothetical protein